VAEGLPYEVERTRNRSKAKFLAEKEKRKMSSIRAIVVDPEVPGRLAIKEVEAPRLTRRKRLFRWRPFL
jgi:hypothetical protein